MDSMSECSTPVLRRKTSRVEEGANHDTKGAIEMFNFAILMWRFTACRLHDIGSSSINITKGIRMPKFTTLVHAEGTVAILETIVVEKVSNNGGWRVFAGGEKNPCVTCLGIGDEEIRVVAIKGIHNPTGTPLFGEGIRTGTHEAKIQMETRARHKVCNRRGGTHWIFASTGITANLTMVEWMNFIVQTRRKTGGTSL